MQIIKDVVKFWLDVLQALYARLGTALALVDYPVPRNSNMRRTSSTRLRHYRVSGIQTGLPIATAARLGGFDFALGTSVLDFGAGVARQLNYFVPRYPDVKFYACDPERSHVAWLTQAYPTVHSHANPYFPPLDYPDATFSLIYSVSVFSHLSPEHSIEWLRELHRITKPGGLICLTTLGYLGLQGNSADFGTDAARRLKSEGFLHFDYPVEKAKRVSANRRFVRSKNMLADLEEGYGVTYLTDRWMQEHWLDSGLEWVGFAEGVIDDLQDLVVLRRPT